MGSHFSAFTKIFQICFIFSIFSYLLNSRNKWQIFLSQIYCSCQDALSLLMRRYSVSPFRHLCRWNFRSLPASYMLLVALSYLGFLGRLHVVWLWMSELGMGKTMGPATSLFYQTSTNVNHQYTVQINPCLFPGQWTVLIKNYLKPSEWILSENTSF